MPLIISEQVGTDARLADLQLAREGRTTPRVEDHAGWQQFSSSEVFLVNELLSVGSGRFLNSEQSSPEPRAKSGLSNAMDVMIHATLASY